jgi:hypothetical protein
VPCRFNNLSAVSLNRSEAHANEVLRTQRNAVLRMDAYDLVSEMGPAIALHNNRRGRSHDSLAAQAGIAFRAV